MSRPRRRGIFGDVGRFLGQVARVGVGAVIPGVPALGGAAGDILANVGRRRRRPPAPAPAPVAAPAVAPPRPAIPTTFIFVGAGVLVAIILIVVLTRK